MRGSTKNLILFTFFSLLIIGTAIGQDKSKQNPSLRNNAIYFTGGYGAFWAMVSGSYERILSKSKNNKLALLAKLSYGTHVSWDTDGPLYTGELGIITGAKDSHLQANLGLGTAEGYGRSKYFLAGSLAYRYQKPGGFFIFRVGGGFPEAAFLSLGVSF